MSNSYLVTGGAGFIGSHLCDRLLANGHRVTCLDDLSTGRAENVSQLAGHPRFTFVSGSVLEERTLEAATTGVDAVFHLAAAVGNDLILHQRVRSIETNVVGTALLLRICGERHLPVLVTSSSEVYGKSLDIPFAEEDDLLLGNTQSARWSYGCGKALAEYLALAHAAETKLPAVVVRLFNTTGPRQTGSYGMVLPRFVRQALRGEPLTVYGDGSQSRCFCDVEDIVPALDALAACEAARGTVVNLGGDQEVTIKGLAERVLAITSSPSPIEHVAGHAAMGEVQRRVPDISRARRLIDFRPRRTLDEIIERLVDFERARDPGNAAATRVVG